MKSLKEFKAALTWGSVWSRYRSARDETVIGRVSRVQKNGVYFSNDDMTESWLEFPKAIHLMFIDNGDGVPTMRINHQGGACYLLLKCIKP